MLRSAGSSQLDCEGSTVDRNIDMQSLYYWRIHSFRAVPGDEMTDPYRLRRVASFEIIVYSAPNERTSEVAQVLHLVS
jgi:hypothetical protein